MASLKATVKKITSRKISLEIDKKDFESFCNACGLYRDDFIQLLDASEKDHQEGRTTERESLYELIER